MTVIAGICEAKTASYSTGEIKVIVVVCSSCFSIFTKEKFLFPDYKLNF